LTDAATEAIPDPEVTPPISVDVVEEGKHAQDCLLR
jgi:hypothetical protein